MNNFLSKKIVRQAPPLFLVLTVQNTQHSIHLIYHTYPYIQLYSTILSIQLWIIQAIRCQTMQCSHNIKRSKILKRIMSLKCCCFLRIKWLLIAVFSGCKHFNLLQYGEIYITWNYKWPNFGPQKGESPKFGILNRYLILVSMYLWLDVCPQV